MKAEFIRSKESKKFATKPADVLIARFTEARMLFVINMALKNHVIRTKDS